MANDVKWIKITTDIFDDEKILLIESLPDAYAIITVWFKLLCLAGKQNNSGVFLMNNKIPYTDKMLATIFRMKESTVIMALQTFEQFGMVEIIDGVITIPNWNKHQSLDAYEKKKARDRLYQAERRANQKALIAQSSDKSSDTSADCSSDVVVSDKEKDKEEDKDINIVQKHPSKSEINDLFEYLWSLYPNKKGKGQVSDSKKKELFAIGKDEMQRAINRYQTDLKKDADWRKPQNGSTFFNSSFVDYLDANYTAPAETQNTGYQASDMTDLDMLF